MTISHHIARIIAFWRRRHPSRVLERAIPEYAAAVERERRARRACRTQEIHRACEAKRLALHRDLAGGRQIGAR